MEEGNSTLPEEPIQNDRPPERNKEKIFFHLGQLEKEIWLICSKNFLVAIRGYIKSKYYLDKIRARIVSFHAVEARLVAVKSSKR